MMSYNGEKVVTLPLTNDSQYQAVVVSAESGLWRIEINGRTLKAKQAFSCLVEPQAGDTVLVSGAGQALYILAILERDTGTMRLSLAEETDICGAQNLSLTSTESLTLCSDRLTQLSTQQVIKSAEIIGQFDTGLVSGERMTVRIGRLQLITDWLQSMAKQAVQQFQNYTRRTEEMDKVETGNMAHSSRGLYSMNSKHTIMVSEKDTRIDGEHIHMG